jgi:hypothetical protein
MGEIVGALIVIGVAIVLVVGAPLAYVAKRIDQREKLRETNLLLYRWLGEYRSPFPWHQDATRREKDAA